MTWACEQMWCSQDRPQKTKCLLTSGPKCHCFARCSWTSSRQEQVCPGWLEKEGLAGIQNSNTSLNPSIEPIHQPSRVIMWCSVLFHQALWRTKTLSLCPQGCPQDENILNVTSRNSSSNITHDTMGSRDTSHDHLIPHWDEVRNLRFNEVKSGFEVPCHPQGPCHHTSTQVNRSSATELSALI